MNSDCRDNIHPLRRRAGRKAEKGQSLVELVLVTPILLLVLSAGFYFGMGLYQAHMASDAIRQPSMRKLEMANEPGQVTEGTVLGYVSSGNLAGNDALLNGAKIDSVSFAHVDNYTSLVVGSKSFEAVNPLPNFNITVAQPLNRKLLAAAHNGARVRPAGSPWVPGGAPRTPLWEEMADLPPDINILPNCQTTPVGDNVANALNMEMKADKTYISMEPVATFSPVPETDLMRIAEKYAGECANVGAGPCQAEYDNLLPDPEPPAQANQVQTIGGPPPAATTYVFEIKNPPGGPGVILKYSFDCAEDMEGPGNHCGWPTIHDLNPNPAIGPDHGRYYDSTGRYDKPPDDFVDSCKSRKAAECQLKKAVEEAERLIQAARKECEST